MSNLPFTRWHEARGMGHDRPTTLPLGLLVVHLAGESRIAGAAVSGGDHLRRDRPAAVPPLAPPRAGDAAKVR
jgi:hypothetical protein